LSQVKVELPEQLPSRLTTLQKACTAKQFDTNPAGCPAASIIGHAKAITPLLPVPTSRQGSNLSGPAYFVSNGNEAFPNLILPEKAPRQAPQGHHPPHLRSEEGREVEDQHDGLHRLSSNAGGRDFSAEEQRGDETSSNAGSETFHFSAGDTGRENEQVLVPALLGPPLDAKPKNVLAPSLMW